MRFAAPRARLTVRPMKWARFLSMCCALLLMMGADSGSANALRDRVMIAYANGALQNYERAEKSARAMLRSVQAFCAAPDEALLAQARTAWIAARADYGRTEVYRFADGPIDTRRGGVETFVNAWPVDENYIEGAPSGSSAGNRSGIIADRARYPLLVRVVLREHNQRGGETHVCTGWHAIEFMLWGRDESDEGPGSRPASDFIDGKSPDADRRREYLLEICQLLCEDLARVTNAWRDIPDAHRQRFLSGGDASLRAMFIGPALLSGFEMSGERLAVALETRDQEEEHSCFSDTTDGDFQANIAGIAFVLRGPSPGSGLIDLVGEVDGARAKELADALTAAERAVAAIARPFDAAIRAPDGSPKRAALEAAMRSLERLSEQVALGARSLRVQLPLEPQG